MTVINQARGTVLGDRVRMADTFWARAKGLLGKQELAFGEGLLITPCRGIHSYGMGFSFDAIYLSQDLIILHTIERMAPGRRGPVLKEARSVLELPAGTIQASATEVGDKLLIRQGTNPLALE
ncbi:MAG: DUF192 domain-containing protein [Firmicutes bacterium]|nr:DUF192 domain-containing protein [Bacillota bacterium]